ncbi:MAG: TIGR03885 family FMN-dependent LLM class oxidoreductase [Methanomassiliicoccus sp.]|nr:TIGR03885 family FMN-dependent LLM class oxidoreductase [Methanomassiliicoccus sp.]
MIIGYHASHEQFSPSVLIELVKKAEAAGFNGALSSDHYQPWSLEQGHSGFAWSWLGAAMQATGLPFGVVTAPVQRYNPAIIAQGAATLAEMYPGRFWVAVGSGQLLNEGIEGGVWPPKEERNQRLKEAAWIIKELWAGRTVSHHGLVTVEEARLFDRPARAPLLIGAAQSPPTAEFVGGWADGMITINQPREGLEEIVNAFRKGGGAGKPMFLKVQVSYARDEDAALRGAWEQWRGNVLPHDVSTDLRSPQHYEGISAFVRPGDIREHVQVSASTEEQIRMIREHIALGFERIYLHNVAIEQDEFIEDFGKEVIPALLDR